MRAEPDGFARGLLDWFDAHGRHDLPWQAERSPYRVWVSEIMLQQTQVATVIPYFERFTRSFPRVARLADAALDDVLAHWSGLGYYARARNLHRSARIVAAEHGGEMPGTLDGLMALPGIGRSTAGAILALARGERHAILDGNVKRVLARYHAVRGWPGESAVAAELWRRADEHTPHEHVAAYTQAIMDLGATLCTRAKPRCESCPVENACAARRLGLEALLPGPRPRRERGRRTVTAVIVRRRDGGILLERRPAQGVWGGLLSFPELADDADVPAWCARELGARAAFVEPLRPVEHAFTHFDLTLHPVLVDLAGEHDTGGTAAGCVMDRADRLWYKSAEPVPGGIAAPIAKLLERFTDERRIA